jgi:hypothetical protein
MMKKDLVFDHTKDLLSSLENSKGKTLIIQGRNSLLGSLQPLIELSPSLANGANIVGGPLKTSLNSGNDQKVVLKLLQQPGFFPFIDTPDLMIKTIDSWLNDSD